MIKKGCKFLIVIVLMLICTQLAYAADNEGKTVVLTVSTTVEPDTYVSFMVVKEGGNIISPNEGDIYDAEVVQADSAGNCNYAVTLENARFGSDGKIENYMLKSSIKGIDINSGAVQDRIAVKIGGEVTEYSDMPLIDENGVVLVPVAETFEKLGVPLSYNAEDKTYTGKGNNGEIIITVGKDTAEIDWVDVEMPAVVQNINGVDMIPVCVIGDAVKTDEPFYDSGKHEIIFEKPQPYEEKEEFDIEKVIETIPAGKELVSNADFISKAQIATGAQYVSIEKTAANSIKIETHKNGYGTIPTGRQGIEVSSWSAKQDFGKGQTGLLSFEIRAISTEDESGNAIINVVYQRSSDWNKALYEKVTVSSDEGWKKVYLPVYSAFYDMNKNDGAHFMLQLGGKPMCIEIKNFSFVNYGTEVDVEIFKPAETNGYKGIEDDAIWRREAYRRIEKYRKNDMQIEVVDESGNPIEDAEVTADMTDNEFMFGVSLCKNEVLDLDLNTKFGAIYNELINNSFNTGVCGMEMKIWDMTEDDGYDGIKMVNEFLSRGKRMRGHAILWEGTDCVPLENPGEASYDEWYKAAVEYARNVAYTFKGKLAQWDVQNEPSASNYLSSKYNSRQLEADIFKVVRRIDPNAKLYINETGMEGMNDKDSGQGYLPGLLNIVRELKRYGAPIDGIGIQGHCVNYNYPQGFYHQIDECAELVDEVSITEYDLLNEKTEYADEYLRDMLLATFSHPKTTAFVVWGVQDAMHWRNAAPFYDREWNERPAMKVWNDMVNKDFATHTSVKTDAHGKAVIRGFRGDYAVKCKIGNYECEVPFMLVKNGENKIVFRLGRNGISAQVTNEPDSIPEPVEFRNMAAATKDYASKNNAYYDVEFFNKSFKGENGIENITVLNGGDLSGEDYLNGLCWASEIGLNGIIAESSNGGVYIKTGEEKSADLRHKLNIENRPTDTDIVFEFNFDTLSCDADDSLDIALCVKGETNEYTLGYLRYSDGKYVFETDSGERAALKKDGEYAFAAEMEYFGGAYTPHYKLTDINGDIIWSYAAEDEQYSDIDKIDELLIRVVSGSGNGNNIFRIWSSGVRCRKDSEIVNFEGVQASACILNESLLDFDILSVKYMGTPVNADNAELTPDDGWGLYSKDKNTNAFGYEENGHYLYAVRNAPSGENMLVKTFSPINNGDELTLKYNMYINCSSAYYDSSGKAILSLSSSNKTVNIDVSSFEYDSYNGFWIKILGEKNGVVHYTKNDWNWVELTVTLKLVSNLSGNYDACVTVTNDYGFKYERTVENALTAAEAEQLSALYILSKTDYAGTRYNAKMCGFKNISINTTTAEFIEKNGAVYCSRNINRYEIPYENVTNGIKEVYVLLAEYKDNVLINTHVIPFELEKDCGKLMFDSGTSADSDSVKVFLIEDINTVRPLKNADTLIITD